MKTVLLASAAVFALSVSGASAAVSHATATSVGSKNHAHIFVTAPAKGAKTLYDQNGNDAGVGIVSQNFDSSVAQYDSQGADDFIVPKGATWTVTEVDVTGVYFNGYGPATSEDVHFYADNNGLPGKEVGKGFTNLSGTDSNGSFAISLGKKGIKLSGGSGKESTKKAKGTRYWVSVVANLGGVADGGEWGWETSSVQNNDLAAWQNQGGGFGICPSWGTLESCLGYGPDYMFALKGSSK